MAGAIKFLQYQMTAYWRRAFSVRGKYDRSSGILLLILVFFAYKYVLILNQTARSIAAGNGENLELLLIIVFSIWTLPALEKQFLSAQISKFLYLPLSKNQFDFINLATSFLLPTTIIAALISLTAVYPLLFAANAFGGAAALLIFALSSALLTSAIFNFLKVKVFRVIAFFFPIAFFFLLLSGKINLSLDGEFLLPGVFAGIIKAENTALNFAALILFLAVTFLLNFFSARQTLYSSEQADRKLSLNFLLRLKLPFKFSELIKKDFIYSWKMLDTYISLLAIILYAILLAFGNFSFQSFSVAISVVLMLSASLAFNNFGMEKSPGIERLSLLPISAKNLIIAKNKSFALVVFSQTIFLLPLVFYKFGFVIFIISILKTISIVLLYASWGNALSIKFPFRMDFYQIAFGGSLAATIYGALLISIFMIVPELLTAENLIAKFIFNVLSLAVCFWIYKFILQKTSEKLPAKWEDIALKLS